ncbi:hypothetical protein [Rubritalea tangerina]
MLVVARLEISNEHHTLCHRTLRMQAKLTLYETFLRLPHPQHPQTQFPN